MPACTSSESAPLGRQRAWKLRARSPCYSCPGLAAHHRPVVSSCRGPRAPGRRRSKPGPWSDSESGPGPVRGVRQLSCDRQYPGSAVPARETWQRQQLSTADCRSSTVRVRAVWLHWPAVVGSPSLYNSYTPDLISSPPPNCKCFKCDYKLVAASQLC